MRVGRQTKGEREGDRERELGKEEAREVVALMEEATVEDREEEWKERTGTGTGSGGKVMMYAMLSHHVNRIQ